MKKAVLKIRRLFESFGVGICFLIIIGFFSIINGYRSMNFWVNDVADYNEWKNEVGTKAETDYITNFLWKMHFVEFNGYIRKILGEREMNGVVKLNNGYLLTTFEEQSKEDLQRKANALGELDRYLKQKDIPMLFAITPYTSSKYDPQLPAGVRDYGNQNIDVFMEMVEQEGVESLDLRQVMYEDGIDQYEMMFRTDHHWTPQAGFYAYTKLEKWIQEKTGCEVDEKVLKLENYDIETYEKWHLGTRGQRVGKYYAGIDDLDVITPKFNTELVNGEDSGTFQEMLIDYRWLEHRIKNLGYMYDYVYLGSWGSYVNPDALNDIKLLIIDDSMGKVVNQYFFLSFKECRFIHNAHADELTQEYLEEYEPDVVVLLYYPFFIHTDDSGFNFQI